MIAIVLAAPAVPVAVKVIGEPVNEPLVAVIVFDPAVVPKVQLPTVAIPLAFVVAVNIVPEPPPVATAKVTDTPDTGLFDASLTITLGAVLTDVPTVALWPSPALIAILLAAPAVPVAVKVIGEPVNEPLVAVIVFDPAVVPRVQLPTVAIPLAFVVAFNIVPEPPPVATAKVTDTPDTGLFDASLTITLGAVLTAVPTVAL